MKSIDEIAFNSARKIRPSSDLPTRRDIIASAIREYAKELVPWMEHLPMCFKHMQNDFTCTCGLDAKLKEINE